MDAGIIYEMHEEIEPSIKLYLSENVYQEYIKKEAAFMRSRKGLLGIGMTLREYNDYLLSELLEIKKQEILEIQAKMINKVADKSLDEPAENTKKSKILECTSLNSTMQLKAANEYSCTDGNNENDASKSSDQVADTAIIPCTCSTLHPTPFIISAKINLLIKASRNFSIPVKVMPFEIISQASNYTLIFDAAHCIATSNASLSKSKEHKQVSIDHTKKQPLLKTSVNESSPAVLVKANPFPQRTTKRSCKKRFTMPKSKSHSANTIVTRSSSRQIKQEPQETVPKSHFQGTTMTTMANKRSTRTRKQGQSSDSSNVTGTPSISYPVVEEDPLLGLPVRNSKQQQTSSKSKRHIPSQASSQSVLTQKQPVEGITHTSTKSEKQRKVSNSTSTCSTSSRPVISTPPGQPSLSDSFLFSTSCNSTMVTRSQTRRNKIDSAARTNSPSRVPPRRRAKRNLPNDDVTSLPPPKKTRKLNEPSSSLISQRKQQTHQMTKPLKTRNVIQKSLSESSAVPKAANSSSEHSKNILKVTPSREISTNINKPIKSTTTTSVSKPNITEVAKQKKLLTILSDSDFSDCEAIVAQKAIPPSKQKRTKKSKTSSMKKSNSGTSAKVDKATLTKPAGQLNRWKETDDESSEVDLLDNNDDQFSELSIESGVGSVNSMEQQLSNYQHNKSEKLHELSEAEYLPLIGTKKPNKQKPLDRSKSFNTQPLRKSTRLGKLASSKSNSNTWSKADASNTIVDETDITVQKQRIKRQAPSSLVKKITKTITSTSNPPINQSLKDDLATTTQSGATQLASHCISDEDHTTKPVGQKSIKETQHGSSQIVTTEPLPSQSQVNMSRANELTYLPSSLITDDESSSGSCPFDDDYQFPLKRSSQTSQNAKKSLSTTSRPSKKELKKGVQKPIAIKSEDKVLNISTLRPRDKSSLSKPPEYLAARLSMLNESRLEKSVLGSKKRLLSSSLSSSFMMVNNPNPSSNEKQLTKSRGNPQSRRPRINPHMINMAVPYGIKEDTY